ncbi:MAG TPA: hypothetical protein O0X01_04465 [Methanocorpusculum sp.]|nr:hypothetical protein [Methanocorpusculum sp.]
MPYAILGLALSFVQRSFLRLPTRTATRGRSFFRHRLTWFRARAPLPNRFCVNDFEVLTR